MGFQAVYVASILKDMGFGSSVIQMLKNTSIKSNLYYEIVDRVDQETFNGVTVNKRPRKAKVYGSTSSATKRNLLIELLHQRVQHHRDKFNSKDIYDELCTMVVKPNGKIEHADDAHDDLVFSYLWALYVFYHGKDLATRFHLMKTEIYTDDHYDETSYNLDEEYDEDEKIDPDNFKLVDDETTTMVKEQLKYLNGNKSKTFEEFYKEEDEKLRRVMENIAKTTAGREAISKTYHVPIDYLEKQSKMGVEDITKDVTKMFYSLDDFDDNGEPKSKVGAGNLYDMFSKL